MKLATIPVYIRFGEIPEDGKSKIYLGDDDSNKEMGVSVWECIFVDNMYYPILPKEANENSVNDYFSMLFDTKRSVYLVTGDKLRGEGQSREPLLTNVKIIKNLTTQYKYIRTQNGLKYSNNTEKDITT